MRALLFIALTASCTVDVGDASAPQADSIDTYIRGLPYLPVDPPAVVQGAKSDPARDGDYQCTTENLKETRQYDRIVAYAANSDSMYPGAIIGADSVLTGLFTQIVLPRAPETISVSLENLAAPKQARSPAGPASIATRVAHPRYRGHRLDPPPSLRDRRSTAAAELALGVRRAGASGSQAEVASAFEHDDRATSSIHADLHTVDLDAPASPSALLAPDITLAAVQDKMNEQRPPVYVSSVTYGRMVLFTFESQYSAEEMSSALAFAYSGGVDVKGDVSVTYRT
jgi:thiol-activated cytolysin